jgi:SAM-dependent methyltransferase
MMPRGSAGVNEGALSGDVAAATAIIDVARELARTMPRPRGAPYFWLDTDVPYDVAVLDAFYSRGIFRKYELALELGSGLGGKARWLAARSGCRIVGVEPRRHAAAAAALLNRRARMDDQVTFCAGRLDSLPVRERVFTHVWMVDRGLEGGTARIFPEAYRVLRPGAHFAMQTELSRPRWDAVMRALREAGFVELEICEAPLADPPYASRLARDRLCTSETAALHTPPHALTCVQIFARRPA